MPQQNVARLAFNRGKVSPLALARTDIERVELSAEEQNNFVPRVLGSMMLRPGWKYLGTALGVTYNIPFVKSTDDTALVELSNGSLRVWENDAVITRGAVSTTIRGGDFASDITTWNKLTDPSSLPASNGNAVAFSPDGQFMAVGHDTTPFVTIYTVSGTSYTKLSNPASLPAAAVLGVAFSPNSDFMAVAHTTTPFVTIYSISGTTFTKLSNPSSLPASDATSVAFSADGQFMAVGHAVSPFVTIYQISGSTFTKLSDPSSLPAGIGQGVAFSEDGMWLSVAHNTTPFVTIYEINGTTFTKISNPASLPAGDARCCTFSRDSDWLVVGHTTTPFVTIYAISGSTFTKQTNPATLPDEAARGASFSSDNQFLALATQTSSPYHTIYQNVSGTWTKITDLGTTPTGVGRGAAFSPNNRILAIAHTTTPFVSTYEAYQWLDLDGSGASSSYVVSPTWRDTFTTTLTSNESNVAFSESTVRQYISDALLTRDGDMVRVTFQSSTAGTFTCENAYIGYSAAGFGPSDNYDFLETPTQLRFSGSSGFSISSGATITSDAAMFNLDTSLGTPILVAFQPDASPNMAMRSLVTLSGAVPYYKTGTNEAATKNVSGYTNYSGTKSLLAVQKIEVAELGAASGLSLVGTGYNEARRVQAVQVSNTDKTVAHAINVVVTQGQVQFHVGTTFGEDDLVASRYLGPGTYSFSFTPNSNLFFVELHAITKYSSIVSSVQIEGEGDMTLPTPWEEADLDYIRHAQSGDVIYVACKDVKPMKLMRFGATSWGIAEYLPEDGPFRDLNSSLITLTASALTGNITLTASRDYFKESMVGTLFRINSVGQATSNSFNGADQFSDPIKVTGVEGTRQFSIVRAGTWSGTVTLQRSVSEPGTWVDVATFTTNGTATYNDDLDNQVIYYRIGIKTGNYTSGTATISMSYSSGTQTGIARVTGYTSQTSVSAIVLSAMGGTTAFESWSEGLWSDLRGFPSAVALYEGRLCWSGNDRVVLSVSDSYESFDQDVEGDSGPILRSIGEGPVDEINWLLPLQRLIVGTEGAERSCRSTSFDEPLTPDNFNMKPASTQGSSAVAPVLIDSGGAFVDRTGNRLFQLVYNFDTYDYSTGELTRLVPDIATSGIKKIAVQRRPDTRVHCVLNDGTVAMLIFEREEDTICWVTLDTDGSVEDVAILPDTPEDAVYYIVKRTIGGVDYRYLERWAQEDECQGGTLNKQADSFVEYSGVSTATLTGLDHLEGETVVVWGDGVDLGSYTVSSGSITVSTAVTSAIIGLPYTARYKSTKLAYAAAMGTALNRTKRIEKVGLILYKTHYQGLRIGDDYDYLRGLPTMIHNKAVVADTIHDTFDHEPDPYNTKWSPDSRLCLEAQAPRPVTILAVTMQIETNG